MRVRYLLIFCSLIIVFSLAACVPAGVGGPGSNYRATADAALAAAQWQEAAQTMTAQAPIVRITETAAALAMQQQLWTATAQSSQSTQVAAQTETAQSVAATATVAVVNAQNTSIANAVARDNLELQRQQNNNAFNAAMGQMAPLLALVLVTGLTIAFSSVIIRKMRYQPAKVDERGNVIPSMDIFDRSFIDIDRSPNFRGKISDEILAQLLAYILRKKFGIKPMLPEITDKRQDKVTENDQMIDLATRGLPATQADQRKMKELAGQEIMKRLTDSNLQSRFRILDGESSDLSVINGEVIDVLDQDWKEAEKK